MEQYKIKEILSQDKYNSLRGIRKVEEAMQDYGNFIRKQTIEEVKGCVPEEKIMMHTYEPEEHYGFNACRQQTLSNLEALKTKE